MNLFFNPSISDLQKLLSKAVKNKPIHDLVIDYDGEVLIDPQVEQPLNKFKFRIQMSKKTGLISLFLSLMEGWNNDENPRASLS